MVTKETPNHPAVDLARRNIHNKRNGFERDIGQSYYETTYGEIRHTRTFGFWMPCNKEMLEKNSNKFKNSKVEELCVKEEIPENNKCIFTKGCRKVII